MEHWGRDGVVSALQFTDLQRDAQHPFTIDASNATFWFDLGNDERPTHHFFAGFRRCRNLIFKGATIDRDPRGNIEGSITRFDAANNRIEVQLSPGVTLPTTFNNNGDQRPLPFKADGSFCAPLYALQRGGVHLKYLSLNPADAGRVWITMVDTALLDTVHDPKWVEKYGETGVLRVGDGVSAHLHHRRCDLAARLRTHDHAQPRGSCGQRRCE